MCRHIREGVEWNENAAALKATRHELTLLRTSCIHCNLFSEENICSLMGYPWSPLWSGYSLAIPEQDCWVVVGLHHIDKQPVIDYPVIPNIRRYGTQRHTAVLPLFGLISVAYWWMLEWLGRCIGSQSIGSRATTCKMLSTVTMNSCSR